MRTLKLVISYDGTKYYGSQKQPDHHTVQGYLENRLSWFYKRIIKISLSGRTDAGVHAMNQVVCYDDDNSIPFGKLLIIYNNLFDNTIKVNSVEQVDNDFDPRRHPKYREYQYWFYFGEKNPFLDKYMLYVAKLDISKLGEIVPLFLGKQDFRYISSVDNKKNTVREIYSAGFVEENFSFLGFEGKTVKFSIRANSFLYHMVRKIVGLLLDVNEDLLTYEEVVSIKNRGIYRGKMAPAKALFLKKVHYS